MEKEKLVKVKIFKAASADLRSAAVSAEQSTFIVKHNCIDQPFSFTYLADLLNESSWHERCLRVKAKVVAGLGLDLKNQDIPEDVKNLLTTKPNKDYSFVELLSRVQLDYELYGNAYIEVVRLAGKVAGLYHLPARDIYAKQDKTGYWQMPVNNLGTDVEFAAFDENYKGELHEVIHFRNYTPISSYYGLPEYLGVIPAIITISLVSEYNIRYFSNSAIPDMAVIVEGGDLDAEAEAAINTYLTNNIKGLANAHNTLFLKVDQRDVKIRIEKLNEVKDGSFKILKDSCRDEIVSGHGVPPRLVGIVVNGALGGTNESKGQLQTFMDIDVRPRQRTLKENLDKMCEQMFKLNPDFYLYELEIRDYNEKITASATAVQAGIMTVDEARDELGYAPMDETEMSLKSKLIKLRKSYVS